MNNIKIGDLIYIRPFCNKVEETENSTKISWV